MQVTSTLARLVTNMAKTELHYNLYQFKNPYVKDRRDTYMQRTKGKVYVFYHVAVKQGSLTNCTNVAKRAR